MEPKMKTIIWSIGLASVVYLLGYVGQLTPLVYLLGPSYILLRNIPGPSVEFLLVLTVPVTIAIYAFIIFILLDGAGRIMWRAEK